MLQSLRERITGIIAWTIIALISVTFILLGIQTYISSSLRQDTAVVVNEAKISKNTLQAGIERSRRAQIRQFDPQIVTPAFEKQLKQQTLERLILNSVLSQAATNYGYGVSREQAQKAIAQIPAFQENGQFSPERFNLLLRSNLFTPEEFLNQVQEDMLIAQFRSGIIATAFTVPAELQRNLALEKQTRDINYVIIPAKNFVKQVKVTPEAIKAYYTQHQAQYQIPEKVSLSYLLLDMATLAKNQNVTDKAARAYYDEHIASYTKPSQWRVAHLLVRVKPDATEAERQAAKAKADKLYAQLKQGKYFASLAKKESDDLASKKDGGKLPWFTLGALDPAFEKAMQPLKKNEFTPPVQTRYGYEIIKLLDKKEKQATPFAKLKDTIKQNLANDQAEKQFADQSETLANLTFVNPESLKPAAEELKLTIQTTPEFTKAGHAEGLGKNARIVSTAFSPDLIEQGNNSDVIQVTPTQVAVIRVKTHQAASVKPLKAVQADIEKQLRNEQKAALAKQYGEKLAQAKPEQAKTLLGKQNLNWQTQEKVGRTNKTLAPQIVYTTFELPAPTPQLKTPMQGTTLANGDYALIKLAKVTPGKSDLNLVQATILGRDASKKQGLLTFELLIQGLMDQAEIVHKD